MAVLDVEQNAVVIRIVYDGPPEAGKTTSLRALSASLARPMTTPAEAGERTLFFDWLEYTGGLFEGHQIRCQIVTVPGQTVLAHRRTALLETADVVVFVSDSTSSAIDTTQRYLEEMRAVLDPLPGPRIGVIVQANKRDRDDAVPLPVVRAAIPESNVAVLESVATEGRGVREAFVFAVRLALDRVRELLRTRSLPVGPPEIASSADLLRVMQTREETSPAWSALAEAIDAELAPTTVETRDVDRDVPLGPDHQVPAGMIWPPVEGRVLLLDACATPFVPRRSDNGDWTGESDGWRFHSPLRASFTDAEIGRRALIEWARLHATGQRFFSSPRAVVLANAGDGTWRLWQIVKAETSLRERVMRSASEISPRGFLQHLLDAGKLLFAATESLALAPCRLSITIDTVGSANGAPLYVGLLPDPFLVRGPQPISFEHRATLLRRELAALASSHLQRFDVAAFPSLRAVMRDGDAPVVIDAVEDVLHDAGL